MTKKTAAAVATRTGCDVEQLTGRIVIVRRGTHTLTVATLADAVRAMLWLEEILEAEERFA